MNRRSFLQACLASATAPYVQTAAGVLMPIRKLITDPWMLTEAALEDMVIEVMSLTDDRGLMINLLPTHIVFPNGLPFGMDKAGTLELCTKILERKRPNLTGFGFTTDWRPDEL